MTKLLHLLFLYRKTKHFFFTFNGKQNAVFPLRKAKQLDSLNWRSKGHSLCTSMLEQSTEVDNGVNKGKSNNYYSGTC